MDSSVFLYDAPPALIETFCQIMDTGNDRFGWRALAVQISPSLLEVRMLERMEASGRSPTRELLWSWAQQNATAQDLLRVLGDMGHHRALQLLQGTHQVSPLPQSKHHVTSSSPAVCPINPPGETPPPTITYHDIIEGTRDFHPDLRIAEGHFSDVYKAQMGNRTFAVKLFKQINKASWSKQWDTFRKEMEIHNLYQHPNILALLCCFSNAGRYCLIYPYLPNGSLSHRLHHQVNYNYDGMVGAEHGAPPLSWTERLTIIKGMAKALHHLHTAQPCPVICGNISSSNILLDDLLQPKLSNFGQARLRPHSPNSYCTVTLDTSSHSNPGYLPEEYIRDGKLSWSLDVYSFGMVIMETVTGRRVIEDTPKHTRLRDVLVTEVEDSGGVDSCLQFVDVSAGRWPAAVALSLLRLALDCTASRHRSRPSMENVLMALSQLLPPPGCPPADQPHSLDAGSPLAAQQSPPPSLQDEPHTLSPSPTQPGPCEYSQSEVTYLSDCASAGGEAGLDLYSSWPVQCSCAAQADGPVCEDCRANGFTPDHPHSHHSDFSVVENPAKQNLRNKLSLYNNGLIGTEELFSEQALQ